MPEYRMIGGDYRAGNPYRGWIPVVLSGEVARELSKVPLHNSVSSLWDTYSTSEGSISFTVGVEITDFLNKSTDGFETKFSFYSSRSEIYRILSTVRNNILDWALRLRRMKYWEKVRRLPKRKKKLHRTHKS